MIMKKIILYSFLVETGKVNYSKEYQSEYNKSYKNVNFPVDERSCVSIPLRKIEKNIAYTITLSTINKKFSSQICILEREDSMSIKQVKAGESTCH